MTQLKQFKKISHHFFRVVVVSTREEKLFTTLQEAEEWMITVVQTFNQTEEFFVSEMTEKSKNIRISLNGEIILFKGGKGNEKENADFNFKT